MLLLVLFVDGSVGYHAELGQRLTAMLEEHGWRSRASGSLTDTGEAATLAALRARALPPRHRIGLG